MRNLPIILATILLPLFAAEADDSAKPMLFGRELPLLIAPDFEFPLAESFHVAKGKWTPEGGLLKVLDLPEEKHIPVLHHQVGLARAVIEVDFLIEGAGSFLVGCDAKKHVGRVIVNAGGLSIAEDSVKPSHVLARLPLKVEPDKWHRLRVEWSGDRMAANLDGHELRAQHDYLATPKSRSWLAAGKSVKVRNLRIRGEKAGS